MSASLISIKDTARAGAELETTRAQFEFRHEDWADRSRVAQELARSISGYEVSPGPRGYVSHRPRWVWVEADPAGRKVPWSDFRMLVPTAALTPIALHVANAGS
jgi:hypothetical protein